MKNEWKRYGAIRALTTGTLLALAACAAGPSPQTLFPTPEAAVDLLVAALRSEDSSLLEQILGPEGLDLIHSGDEVADRNTRREFLEYYDEQHHVETSSEDTAILCVGELDWPMPIPMVREGGSWRFDTDAGREEILDRRIGKNELAAAEVCLATIDAQREYVSVDRDGDGILEYAAKFGSTPGARDGLYWPTEAGEPPSPLGELAAEAAAEGYTRRQAGEARQAFHGYFYRMLTAQGPEAPGGAYDYMAGDNMIGGCALVAWPAEYGVSGIMTFIVSLEGQVFERDLGEESEELAATMPAFDPDESWLSYSQ